MIDKIRGLFVKIVGTKKRKEKLEISNIKRILLPVGRIGDVICMTPFIRELHRTIPQAQMDIYLEKAVAPILEQCPYVNVIETKRSSRKIYRIKFLRVLNTFYDSYLKRKKYDLCFDFGNSIRFYNIFGLRILAPKYLIGVPRQEKFGLKKEELTIFDRYIEKADSKHMADICLATVEILGGKIEDRKYQIYLGDLERKYEGYFPKDSINIMFNYVGGTENKNLSLKEVKESCERLIEIDKKIKVYVLVMPKEYEEVREEIKKWKNDRITICEETKNILEAAAMIKNVDILVSVDTGVVHIASAYNIPVISIFANNENSIEFFAPRSELSYIIKCDDKHYIKNFDKEKMSNYIKEIIKRI